MFYASCTRLRRLSQVNYRELKQTRALEGRISRPGPSCHPILNLSLSLFIHIIPVYYVYIKAVAEVFIKALAKIFSIMICFFLEYLIYLIQSLNVLLLVRVVLQLSRECSMILLSQSVDIFKEQTYYINIVFVCPLLSLSLVYFI